MKKIFISLLVFFIFGSLAIAQVQQSPYDTNPGAVGQKNTNTGTVQTNTGTKVQENQVLPKIGNPLKDEFSDIPSLVNGLVKIALQLGTIIAVLALVWVGFKFIIAQGNPTEIAKAREALWWVIIGIAILFGAQIIVEIIKGTLSDFVDPAKINFKKP